jgi:hypothetical protein
LARLWQKSALMVLNMAARTLLASMMCAWLVSCGGQGSGAASADSTGSGDSSDDSTEGDDSSDSEGESAESDSSGASRSSSTRAVTRATCASGGCSECGEGACPPGMFCIKSGANTGCSWFPECGNNADCNCISKHIGSNCRCEAQGQFARVTCQD